MSRRFKIGDVIAYRMKDLHGITLITGEVTGYNKGKYKDWVSLRTYDGVSVSIPDYIPVEVPVVWADSLRSVH